MKQLSTTARNIRHSVHEKKIITEIEVVLGLSERVARIQGSDAFLSEEMETVRFSMTTNGARGLAEELVKFAEEGEAESDRLSVGDEE
jgi:hypothetical protein